MTDAESRGRPHFLFKAGREVGHGIARILEKFRPTSTPPVYNHAYTKVAGSSECLLDEPEKGGDAFGAVSVDVSEVDSGAQLVAGFDGEFTQEEADGVRKKIDLHVLPLMCILYWVQFMDKTTLGSSAILGIKTSNHLSANQYNWLGTIFYLSYLVFEYPQNLALQRFPVGKWMSLNISILALALCLHAACHSFVGLFVVRLILGMCEGSITAGFLLVSGMFYTRAEQTRRVGYWFLMNGTAQIVSGFISYGTLHIHTPGFEPWQWLMMITGSMTLLTSVVFWAFFPDSPVNAWFLTPRERVIAVHRIKSNQTGVENKTFKKEQMIEALLDPKTWLFALFACLDNIPNSLTNQRQIVVTGFGFTTFQTTLLGCVDGVIEMITIFTGVQLASRIPNSYAWVAAVYMIPDIVGSFLLAHLPPSNRLGLLFSEWITGVGTTGFVLALAWVSQVTAGHTKRITTNAIMLSAYCVGNAVGPFMWQERFAPRNQIPWLIISICYIICPLLLLLIRFILSAENQRRDEEPHDDSYDDLYISQTNENGDVVQIKLDRVFLDLTDRQNRDFRYVL